MGMLAGALTGLGLLALPAIPSLPYFAPSTVSDTWSLSIAESSDIQAATPPAEREASDTWSLGALESPCGVETYPAELTYPRLALPGKYAAVTAKSSPSIAELPVADQWFLVWAESPVNALEIDTWDAWSLSFGAESVGVSITQTYAATDIWALSLLDVGSVFVGGPVLAAVSDTWSLTATEGASAVASVAQASDTWSLSLSESVATAVAQDAIAASDIWSLSFQTETAFYSVLVEIPIIASDQWALTVTDVGLCAAISLSAPNSRRVIVFPQTRIVVVTP